MRILRCLVATILLLGVLTGCGGQEAPGPGAAASPINEPVPSTPTASADAAPPASAAAVAALKALQRSLSRISGVRLVGRTEGSPVVGRRAGTANLETGEFRGRVSLGNGETLEMIRQSDTAWTRAPVSYWTRLGYTRESARAAREKWVVASVTEIKPLVDSIDPGAVIAGLLALDPEDGVRLRDKSVLVFGQDDAVQRVYFTPGVRPVLRRVSSTRDGVTTIVDFVGFPSDVRIQRPPAAGVLVP